MYGDPTAFKFLNLFSNVGKRRPTLTSEIL